MPEWIYVVGGILIWLVVANWRRQSEASVQPDSVARRHGAPLNMQTAGTVGTTLAPLPFVPDPSEDDLWEEVENFTEERTFLGMFAVELAAKAQLGDYPDLLKAVVTGFLGAIADASLVDFSVASSALEEYEAVLETSNGAPLEEQAAAVFLRRIGFTDSARIAAFTPAGLGAIIRFTSIFNAARQALERLEVAAGAR